MSFTDDEELLQDFLVEAGEILEKLSEQLVELERSPDNLELLNAIFRGFHTVKGGAGFLQIDALVECCHKTENLFDILRNKKRVVDAELMDVTLQVLDVVNAMFASLQERQLPEPASPQLLAALEALVSGASAAQTAPASVASPVSELTKVELPKIIAVQNAVAIESKQDISDQDFENFVASLQDLPDSVDPAATHKLDKTEAIDTQSESLSAHPASLTPDEISDEEFEALLDSLHGKAKPGGKIEPIVVKNKVPEIETPKPVTKSESSQAEPIQAAGANDEIADDEFEILLDKLHGRGSAPGKTVAEKPTVKVPESASPVAATPDKTKESVPSPAPVVSAPVKPAPVSAKDGKEDDEHKNADQKSSGVSAENTVRVDTQRLDDIMNMVGELVLVRNRLVRLGTTSTDEEISKAISNLDVVTGDLQTSVMKTRMQPIKKVFGRFPRVVRDLARNLRKEVSLELMGEETDLDKNLVEALADPLVHLVRNAVDHGIELPDVRERAGKMRQGTVMLAAEQEGDHILLTITDDGAGMDPEKLRAKAVEKGLLEKDAADRLSDRECFELIFAPGFSTKTEISDVSGRGVGMDVVKTKIAQLNGLVEIDSTIGKGSRISIKVPLTLAIMPTLMVMLGEQIFAFPLVSVNEIFNLDVRSTNVVDGQEVIVVRDKTIPLFHLKRWLVRGADKQVPENSHVVVVSVGTQKVGFVVDQLIGQEEVVIKPLGKMLIGTPGVAGATITGDGTIALILDVPSMLNKYAAQAKSEKPNFEKQTHEQSHAA